MTVVTMDSLCDLCNGDIAVVHPYIWDNMKKTVTWDIEGCDGSRHKLTTVYKLVSRDEAMEITGETHDRIRNYELEMELHDLDVGYFIYENCPINGFKTVPEHVVKQYLRELEA